MGRAVRGDGHLCSDRRAHRGACEAPQLDDPYAEGLTAVIPFAKGHGLGNDYLVIEQADLPGPLSERGHRQDL